MSPLPPRRHGITLVELLTTIAIIGILLAMMGVLTTAGLRFVTRLETFAASAAKLLRPPRAKAAAHALVIPGQYIIMLREGCDPRQEAHRLATVAPLEIVNVYERVFKGFSARLTPSAAAALLQDQAVHYLEQDQLLTLARVKDLTTSIRRIDAWSPDLSGQSVDADIAIIDTGVDPTNASLRVVARQGFGHADDARDTDGHGTQVASIAAAAGPQYAGVAPGARIWALKVASTDRSGSASALIGALDFVLSRAKEIDVANVSVTTTGPSPAVNAAAAACVRAGVVVVAAAGNGMRDVQGVSPAGEPSVITVAALADTDGFLGGRGPTTSAGDADDTLASFSNFGMNVDFVAPGVQVAAVDLDGKLSSPSGTSFAAAHVAGLAARIRDRSRLAADQDVPCPRTVFDRLEANVRERIPGPGRYAPYAVASGGLRSTQPINMLTQSSALQSMPLSYEVNRGQTDPTVKYLTRARNCIAFLTSSGLVLSLPQGRVHRMLFAGANPNPAISGQLPLPGAANYFIGNDPTRWRTNVPTCAQVYYDEVYNGIDFVFNSSEQQVRFDIVVAPFADPGQVALDFPDAVRLETDRLGRLVVGLGGNLGNLIYSAPVLFQPGVHGRETVRGRYVVVGGRQVRFEIGEYDRTRELIIDPTIFSTYLGGTAADGVNSVAVDGAGNLYATGTTASANFPIVGGVQSTKSPGPGGVGPSFTDMFVTKFNASGTKRIYSTYVGAKGDDDAKDIAVDGAGNAYVVGEISNTPITNPIPNPLGTVLADAFPTTPGVFEREAWGNLCIAVFKLNPAGDALVWSTIPNGTDGITGGKGSDRGWGIAVDAAGYVYITGECDWESFSMTATAGAYQPLIVGNHDAFVMKINPTAATQVYLTFIGGSGEDYARDIAVDGTGNVYIVGITQSADFPFSAGAYQTVKRGFSDVFVAKIKPAGTGLADRIYATSLGGNGADEGLGIAIDSSGNAYVTGSAGATGGLAFPTTPGALQTTFGGGSTDAFVAKVNSTGTALSYSTFLGGTGDDAGRSIAINFNKVYIGGDTSSGATFPTADPLQLLPGGGFEGFVAGLCLSCGKLTFGTHIGGTGTDSVNGIALYSTGELAVGGRTSNNTFPAQNPIQPYAGSTDGFVGKIALPTNPDVAGTSEVANVQGTLSGLQTLMNRDTYRHANGQFDDDWYRWVPTKTGTLQINVTMKQFVAAGPNQNFPAGGLGVRVYRIVGGNLIEYPLTLSGAGQVTLNQGIASTSNGCVVDVTVGQPIPQGEPVLVWVYGIFFTQAQYDLTVDLK